MVRILAIVAAALALSASAAMAQVKAVPVSGDGVPAKAQTRPQQAMLPAGDRGSVGTFIFDEYGNVYDARGDIIKPRPLKH
ncbi:hypothetical protein [Reyranella sp.]|jgi:hypothetical protein|uniref:hypothetical protein n=1 Tax=Reyranella sp. TaxID=1929291 RepID=UPI002F947442